MDEFGPKLDWGIADRIMLGEDAAAYAVARFQDRDFESSLGKFHCGRQSSRACAENNNVGIIRHEARLEG